MVKCDGCQRFLSEEETIKCSRTSCSREYHFSCVGVDLANKKEIKIWVCPLCCAKEKKKGDNSDTPVRSVPTHKKQPDTLDNSSITIRKKAFSSLSSTASDDNTSIILMRDEILSVLRYEIPKLVHEAVDTAFQNINAKFLSLEQSIQMVCNQYDDFKKIIDDQAATIKKVTSENKNLRTDVKNLEDALSTLEQSIAKQEQWCRLQNLELAGLPELPNETLSDTIIKIARCAKLPLEPSDIDFAHRVQAKRPLRGKPRSVVVRFNSRLKKDLFLSAARKLRNLSTNDLGMSCDKSTLYLNEHLTVRNKQLLHKCKLRAREAGYKFVWTKNCRIYTRKNEKSPFTLVSSESDLCKIV